MKKLLRFFCFMFPFLLAVPALCFAGEFRVTRVYDGDTVKAGTPDIIMYVMLVGIDAPEISNRADQPDQAFGQKAREVLSSLVLNQPVVVEGYGTVPYPDKNIISVIHVKGQNVNLEMVKRGLAEVHRENLPQGFDIVPYLKAENEAKEAKRGMWVLGDNYISPAQWRTLHGSVKEP
ncbi:MAG: thermonuclease family protein [Deltaproteobacteria bacterium]|nr:thermonuclease family protein [Deltaproteobacteria bacterium]